MRCVKEDHTAINMTLHYLDNGTVMLNFIYQKELFFLPLGFALKVRTRPVASVESRGPRLTSACRRSRLWWTSPTSRSTRS